MTANILPMSRNKNVTQQSMRQHWIDLHSSDNQTRQSSNTAPQPTGSSWRPGPLGAPWHLPDHEHSKVQATLPPVWSEIERYRRRRGRVTLEELSEITARAHQMHMQELRRLRELHERLDWPRVHRPEILLYTPNQLRQLIRLGNAADTAPQPTSSGSSWRPGPLGAPWHLPDHEHSSNSERPIIQWGSWGSWCAGLLLLLTALLLLRLTDRCLTRNYTRRTSSRRRSEEWPVANVLATSVLTHMLSERPINVDAETSPNEIDTYPSEPSDASNDVYNPDLPPPYSECNKHIDREEPPPPYSACYVAYSNPKDGSPSVRFFNSQRQNMFESDDSPTSNRYMNVQTSTDELTEIAHSSNGFNHFDTGQALNNPIGDRIYKLPYFDNTNTETDDSDECNGECIVNSVECINVGAAPLATQDMSIDIPNVSIGVDVTRYKTAESC